MSRRYSRVDCRLGTFLGLYLFGLHLFHCVGVTLTTVLSRCLSLWPQSFLLGCAEGSACSLVLLSRKQKEEEEGEEETRPGLERG